MKDALGGYFNLTLLFFFILLVSGFIALSVNYTKAYRVKNNVLTYLEKYEGNVESDAVLSGTKNYIKSIGYTVSNDAVVAATNKGYTCPKLNNESLGWCYIKNRKDSNANFTVDIVVFINLDIPMINQMLSNFDFFWMTGTTSSIPIMD